MKVNILNSQFFEFAKDHLGEWPTLIAMHPQTWIELIREVRLNLSKDRYPEIPIYINELTFRGVKVIRSEDITTDVFLLK